MRRHPSPLRPHALPSLLVALLLFLPPSQISGLWFGSGITCDKTLWEARLDSDLGRFEESGITREDLAAAQSQACGGYIVSISNDELYALPFGWEALPQFAEPRKVHPHNFLVIWTKLLCAYPGKVPSITFLVNTFDKMCVENRERAAPLISWGKDTVSDDPQILMPYWTFMHLKGTVAKLGPGPMWETRKEVAIWRGTTTGGHFSRHNWMHFPRSQLVRTCNHSTFCDAKFTGYPQATKEAEEAIRAAGGHAKPMNMSGFLKHKYIIINDGNMAPSSRLSIFLHTGSLLLKQESPSIEFYYDDLKPYKHYVPLSYSFGDVEQKVKWASRHDNRAKRIAARAAAYAKDVLTEPNMYCYMYRLAVRYSKAQRFTDPGAHNASWQHVPRTCDSTQRRRRGKSRAAMHKA